MTVLSKTYAGKKVLITGHTGFKGSWLTLWLRVLGADVVGISDRIPSSPSNFEACSIDKEINDYRIDIRDIVTLKKVISEEQPDFVFHLAAQALVRPSYKSPLDTIETNAVGSANVLEAVRQLDKSVVVVMITSDKAYDNVEWVWGYRETDRLGGKDPYSASKGMAELAIRTYVESYFSAPDSNVRLGITRAGNVIGGGDWAEDRIIPDCMKAWANNEEVEIRSPHATRPWQHVLEPLSGYLVLGAQLANRPDLHGEAYNFGPPAHQNHSVKCLIDEMSNHWESIQWRDTSQVQEHLHEAGLLKLNCDKALFDLEWRPTMFFEETVKMTVDWYRSFYDGGTSMHDYTLNQIQQYSQLASKRNQSWAKNG